MIPRCGAMHSLYGMACNKKTGHAGSCYSRWEPVADRAILQRAVWVSRHGVFKYHEEFQFTSTSNRAAGLRLKGMG